MTATAETKRHPGRRPATSEKVTDKHLRVIGEAEKKRRKLEDQADAQVNVLAERISKAMADNVQTQAIADSLGISRQMVYKLVRERVDGKPLGQKPSKNGSKAD